MWEFRPIRLAGHVFIGHIRRVCHARLQSQFARETQRCIVLKAQADKILASHSGLRLTRRVTRATLPGKVESENENSGLGLFAQNARKGAPNESARGAGKSVELMAQRGNT